MGVEWGLGVVGGVLKQCLQYSLSMKIHVLGLIM